MEYCECQVRCRSNVTELDIGLRLSIWWVIRYQIILNCGRTNPTTY